MLKNTGRASGLVQEEGHDEHVDDEHTAMTGCRCLCYAIVLGDVGNEEVPFSKRGVSTQKPRRCPRYKRGGREMFLAWLYTRLVTSENGRLVVVTSDG